MEEGDGEGGEGGAGASSSSSGSGQSASSPSSSEVPSAFLSGGGGSDIRNLKRLLKVGVMCRIDHQISIITLIIHAIHLTDTLYTQ